MGLKTKAEKMKKNPATIRVRCPFCGDEGEKEVGNFSAILYCRVCSTGWFP